MMEDRPVIVIGAGMGGLACGALLAHEGFRVTVLEKQACPGGGLGSFTRDGTNFDIGAHTVFGFGAEGAFGQVCDRLGIRDSLMPRPLNAVTDGRNIFGRVYSGISDKFYDLPSGREAFENYFSSRFPLQAGGLHDYLDCLYSVAGSVPVIGGRVPDVSNVSSLHSGKESLADVLGRYIDDEELKSVLSWITVYTGMPPEESLFSLSTLITKLFIEESCQIRGGIPALRDALVSAIEDNGGQVLSGHEVSSFLVSGHSVTAVLCGNGRIFPASAVVSSMPLDVFLPMFSRSVKEEDKDIYARWISRFRKKIDSRSGKSSMFSLFIKMKPCVPATVFDGVPLTFVASRDAGWPSRFTVIPYVQDGFAVSVQVHAAMSFDDVLPWASSVPGSRPAEYEKFKASRSGRIMSLLDALCPGFGEMTGKVWTSSPLTVRDWLGRTCGNVYGMLAVPENGLPVISVRTPADNLFLAGEDVRFHGLCGVPATSIECVEAILSEISREID